LGWGGLVRRLLCGDGGRAGQLESGRELCAEARQECGSTSSTEPLLIPRGLATGLFIVVWLGPARGWRELWFDQPSRNRKTQLVYADGPGFTIYNRAKWLPEVYRFPRLDRYIGQQQLRQAQQILRENGSAKILLYLWRPEFEPAINLIEHNLSIYHIDDEYSFSSVEQPVSEDERQLIAKVGQVFIHSPALMEKKRKFNPHTAFVPNGVDYEAYVNPIVEPGDLTPIPHPRIGYTGWLKKQLDWSLLRQLARQHSQWSFIFVGPMRHRSELQSVIQDLSCLRNVYFLGAKSSQQLAEYPQHFDVCIMPYLIDDYTKYIYPLKLHEYLASGRPVVASPIRTLEDFVGVVKLARRPDEWSEAIGNSLLPATNSLELVAKRRSVARKFDWNTLVRRIAGELCERLGPSYSTRFHEIDHPDPDDACRISEAAPINRLATR